MKQKNLTRRDFLKSSMITAGTLPLIYYRDAIAGNITAGNLAIVVKVTHPEMVKKRYPDPDITERMLEAGIKRLTGKNSIEDAWREFVKPEDRVVIKVNCLAGRLSSTSRELVDGIIKGILATGVKESNIVIMDQYKGSMRQARFIPQLKKGDIRIIPHPLMDYTGWIRFGSHRAKISKVFLWADVVINVPVFKDHDLAGITGAIKNISCGVVEKPHLLHRDIHHSIVNFYNLDDVRSRIKLTIADASWVLYNGGPKHNFQYREKHNSIYISKDPVAIDRVEYEVIDSLRKKHRLKPLALAGRAPKFIEVAQEKGLGTGDIKRIKLEELQI